VVAGVTRMPFLKFLICNAIGAALWVGVWSSAGYFAGNHLDAIEGAFHRYSNVALAAIVVLVAAYIWHHVRRRRAHRAEDLKAESDNPSPAR
jgi:membrane protein DedA with SNARE-associated domain